MKTAIVLVVDSLGAAALGAYGNTSAATPAIDDLAGRSFLFDFHHTDSPRLQPAYRGLWTGGHAAGPAEGESLGERLAAAGVSTRLLTDVSPLAEQSAAVGFQAVDLVPARKAKRPAGEVDETHAAAFFGRAIETLSFVSGPTLLWIHACGLSGTWDAPLELRERFRDEEDPPPARTTTPPRLRLDAGHDPDELLPLVQAHAGQVALIDMAIGALVRAVDEQPWAQGSLLAVTAPRGFPLGEHLVVGEEDALYGELLHVPLVVRLPDDEQAAQRSAAITQGPDLAATLLDFFTAEPHLGWGRSLLAEMRGEADGVFDRAAIFHEGGRILRTPAWLLREQGERQELYAKPDDHFEANEVADRCRDVTEEASQALAACETALRAGDRDALPPLSELLLDGYGE